MALDYSKKTSANAIKYTEALLEDFPDYAAEFINQKIALLSPKTAKAYATDLDVFFSWIVLRYPECCAKKLIALNILTELKPKDLSDFVSYLQNDPERMNSQAAINRKFVTLRQFYQFLNDNDYYNGKNPAKLLKLKRFTPKPDYEHLTDEESRRILSYIVKGKSDSSIELVKKSFVGFRNFVIVLTLLGTGLRVSELVGLDIADINFAECKLRVVRKGKAQQGEQQFVFMNDEVALALKQYLPMRNAVRGVKKGSENALFLSSHLSRIGVTTIEVMLKKYVKAVGINRNISPHKLRKTYGMRLYNNGTDIYVVSKMLGHSDVKITTQHYVEPSQERLEKARKNDSILK